MTKLEETSTGDERTALRLLREALAEPLRRIATNAGQEGAVVVDAVRRHKDPNYGYDARNDSYGDMIQQGILDPIKVVRSALENAVSIGGMVLSTESLVADIPEAPSAMPAPPEMPEY